MENKENARVFRLMSD